MPLPLNEATGWKGRAREALDWAYREKDPAIKAWLLGVATEYVRLWHRTEGERK
jgi:hypothetical protein